MAIAYDNASPGKSATSPLTFSHTCGASASLLVVHTFVSSASVVSWTVAVTYAGTSMTAAVSGTNNVWKTFYLESPSAGANNVVVTVSGGTFLQIMASAVSYSGTATSSSLGATNSAATTSNTYISTSVTTLGANSIVTYGVGGSNTTGLATWTADGGQTERTDQQVKTGSGGSSRYHSESSGEEAAGAVGSSVGVGATSTRTEVALGITAAEFYVAPVTAAVKDIIGPGIIAYAR